MVQIKAIENVDWVQIRGHRILSMIKSPFSEPWSVLARAQIWRLVVHIKAIEKRDLPFAPHRRRSGPRGSNSQLSRPAF
jgi:hypothetical protein